MVNDEDFLAQFIALHDKASSCNVVELRRLDDEKQKRAGVGKQHSSRRAEFDWTSGLSNNNKIETYL